MEDTTPTAATTEETQPKYYYVEAGRELRVANFIVDMIIIHSLVALFAIIAVLLNLWDIQNTPEWAIYIIVYSFMLVYYYIFESMVGKTPAKFITKTRVVDYDNNQPGKMTILGRTLCRFIPFDGLSFLGLSGFHDKFSNTKVIIDKPQII